MTRHSVGGEARRIAAGSVGSSPAVSITETRIKVLRNMLNVRDRWLEPWHACGKQAITYSNQKQCLQWDAERKAIREKIKSRGKPDNV